MRLTDTVVRLFVGAVTVASAIAGFWPGPTYWPGPTF
jgi:hypothetical protein